MNTPTPRVNSATIGTLQLMIERHPSELCVFVLKVHNLDGVTTQQHIELALAMLQMRGKDWKVNVNAQLGSVKFLYLQADENCLAPAYADGTGELFPASPMLALLAGEALKLSPAKPHRLQMVS